MSTVTINASILNVRQTPSPDAPVVTQLPRDTQVEKVSASDDGQWFQIRTSAGTSGWIAAKYAVEAGAPAAAPAAPAQAWVSINASLLNVRETPDSGGRVLTQLARDTRVQKVGASPDAQWVQVRTADGTQGWVSAQYAVPSQAPSAAPTGTSTPAPAPSGEEPKWLTVARGEIGQTEIEGAQNNPRIVEYHAATSLHASDDETPWCSAFANWCMKQAGIKGTGEANARSWLNWGRQLSAPVAGCVVVLKRGNSTTSGHVTFYVGRNGDYLQVLGGNQSNKVKISNYPVADVLGYRWPNA
jgi:uncharacterized protein (TIGR02594 family)